MSAVLSPCQRYRYFLTRDVDLLGAGRMLFVMLNPSVADATLDDPTIRKCRGFAQRAGMRTFNVVNLYAWRATDPDDLRRAADANDIIGPANDLYIGGAVARADIIVAAWGALNMGSMSKPAADRAREVSRRFLTAGGRRPHCLGTAKNGQPRHPLMVSYSVKLQMVAP